MDFEMATRRVVSGGSALAVVKLVKLTFRMLPGIVSTIGFVVGFVYSGWARGALKKIQETISNTEELGRGGHKNDKKRRLARPKKKMWFEQYGGGGGP